MDLVLILLSVMTLGYLSTYLLECIFGMNSITKLSSLTLPTNQETPRISIILSALNEEKHLRQAIDSLMLLNYPNYEVIALNDRSTDHTASILNELKEKYPALCIKHITELPHGWLGKNHALNVGARMATGEWLLFTDADVSMHGEILERAIHYTMQNKLDHLTVYEQHHYPEFWLVVLLLTHYVTYSMSMRPWRIRYRWSKRYLGRGAFNLIKKSTYEKCGTHQSIALECLDDMALGKLIKTKGYRQDIVDAKDMVDYEWYSSGKDMIKGFEKNGFAYFNYNIFITLSSVFFGFLFFIWPIVAAIFFSGVIQMISIANVMVMLMLNFYIASKYHVKKRFAFTYPLGISMLMYSVFNSLVAAYKNKGVVWRGTHYSLNKLKSK